MKNKQNQKETNNHFGVLLYHLKGKFALADEEGQLLTDFQFTGEQAVAIQNYLREGLHEGMFDKVEESVYKTAIGIKYKAMQGKSQSSEGNKALIGEYLNELNKLALFRKAQILQKQEESLPQPE